MSSSPFDSFFSENPPPSDLNSLQEQIKAFSEFHKEDKSQIVLVTSGGTTVPFEKQTVRFLDNFSAGTRGSASAEHFIQQGYPVIFLHRSTSLKPYNRHLAAGNFLQVLEETPDGNVVVQKEHLEKTRDLLRQFKLCQDQTLLLSLPFTTLSDYLWLLRACCTSVLQGWGPKAMLYLAAAVADFYLPATTLSEHKMQSSEGAPEVKLNLVPKMLRPLVTSWVPNAFVVSFKLETDERLLLCKARRALENYGHSLVVGNLLHTRKTEVVLVSSLEEEQIVMSEGELKAGMEIESKIVSEIKKRHQKFMQEK